MTMHSYPAGWFAGSQVRGKAQSPSDYAWNVNFNDGNSNRNNQNNEGFVRAVRAGECQGAVSLADLHTAWNAARRGKKPSADQLAFDARWIDGLLALQASLNAGTWSPAPPTLFIAREPKAREIHAPAFSDRVVHHYVVPRLEAIYEPTFIFDSYSNRKGKGTHAAVKRLEGFVRQVHAGQGGGFFLQLDVRNFFNSIHRPTLYGMLKDRMKRATVALPVRRAVHALLRRAATEGGVQVAYSEAERARVPAHKRLENAAPGCGIAIGNLSSQFFANVYLDALDQFVKHELKATRYLRYVDDFVIVHRSAAQLATWHAAIARFLEERLRLVLKPGAGPRPLERGIDFLGYVVFPTHTVVRRRVIGHCRAKLLEWERANVRGGKPTADGRGREQLRSVWASYMGHFARARSHRSEMRIRGRFPWLSQVIAS